MMKTWRCRGSKGRFLSSWVACCLLWTCVCGSASGAGFVEEFADVENWRANNPKAPAKFTTDGNVLTLIDPPGGKVTWGTSIYRAPVTVDLKATPYFVAKVVETTGTFAVTLVNQRTKGKRSGVVTLREPGLAVADVPETLGWTGKVPLVVGLYVRGAEKSVKVDYVKFTGQLTPDQKKALAKALAQRPTKHHGLTELAKRRGWRQLVHVRRGDAYLSERTVFRDSTTGAPAWRMTCDPAVDKNDYYDIPAWNANGSLITFLTRRTGSPNRWLMDANGGRLRPFPAPEGSKIGRGYWSLRHPNRFYTAAVNENGTRVIATNPHTGEQRVVVRVDRRDLGAMQPPHPTEKWFLFGRRVIGEGKGSPDDPSEAYVVGVDGSVQTVRFERRWHRLRFTKSPDARLFFNFDEPRTQWTILPDGSGRTSIPKSGGHPDWIPGGKELTFYTEGKIWAIGHDGTGLRTVATLGSGGHGGPCLDGEWFASDTSRRGKYAGSILTLRTDGSETVIPLFRHMSSYFSHSVKWHPDHHSTHPHPVASPDGTKILFNSDFLGQYTDVYVSVARMPDPPRALMAYSDGGWVMMRWQPPRRSREIRGYLVYSSDRSGLAYERMTPEPIASTMWREPSPPPPGYYVVTAVEHSGLESGPSNEAYQLGMGRWQGHARVFLEAEAGKPTAPMREGADFRAASNAYYVGCAENEPGGALTVDLLVPKEASYVLWARVQGTGVLAVSCDKKRCGTVSCAHEAWSWVKLGAPTALTRGRHVLKLDSQSGGERVDKLVVTDDAKFEPQGTLAVDATPPASPKDLKVAGLAPNALRLTWSAVQANDVDRYNVYCGPKADFACDQGSLIGSPCETEMVDWGLELNTSYSYKVTAVDRAGNESAPCKPVAARTAPFDPVRVALKANRAEVKRMDVVASKDAGGRVLKSTEQDQAGEAVWRFDLPRDATCAVWARVRGTKKGPANCVLQIDDGRKIPLKTATRWDQWGWSPAGGKLACSPELFDLKAGSHTLRLRPRRPGAQIAEIVITDDPQFPLSR